MLIVRLPDGTQQQISSRTQYGRGTPPNLTDPQLSREQILLEAVDGMEGVLQLTNIGLNAILVESQQTAAAAAAGAGISCSDMPPGQGQQQQQQQQAFHSHWQLTDLLDKGQSTIIGPNTRFYLASRQGTTTFTLLQPGSASPAVAASQHTPAKPPQQQQQQHQQIDGGLTQALSRAEQEAADAAFAAALHLQQQQQQQPGPGSASMTREDQEAADAALAAALAAEESEEEQTEEDDDAEGDGEEAAAAAAAEESESQECPASAAAAEEGEEAVDRPAKRVRREQQQTTAGGGRSTAAAAAAAGRSGGVPPPSMAEAPFSLLAVRGLPSASNAGCLGARLSRLVAGPQLSFVLVSNFMIDMGWLLSACPAIATADRVLVVHGERGVNAALISEQAAAAGLTSPRFAAHAPPLPITYGTHHSKAFLLGYRHGGLRLIAHTANLIYPDCNNKTQGMWFQDFPPKAPGAAAVCEFESCLTDYLRALQLPGLWAADVARLVAGVDFSAARAALLPSVPGYHAGTKLHAYGHLRLRSVLAASHLPARFQPAPCLLQFSSLGSIDDRWLRHEMVASMTAGSYCSDADHKPAAAAAAAAAGFGAQKAPAAAPGGGGGSSSNHSAQQQQAAAASCGAHKASPAAVSGGSSSSNAFARMRQAAAAGSAVPGGDASLPLHLVWTTAAEVQQSREGWAGGGSIPGRHDNVMRPFLQQHYCRWGGEPAGRQSAMPHIKSYTRYLPANTVNSSRSSRQADSDGVTQPAAGAELAWCVVTSHNLSKAAWGSLQKGGSQLMIRSYELGVLLTPELEEAYRAHPHRHYSCTDEAAAAAAAAARGSSVPGSSPTVRFYAWPGLQQQQQQQQQQQGVAVAVPSSAGSSSSSSSSISSSVPVLLPLPYLLPPKQYEPGDVPWCVDPPSQFPGVDTFGYTCGNTPLRYYGNTEPPWES